MSKAKIQGDLWDTNANDWAEIQEHLNLPLFDVMLNATLVHKGTRFLDVGCGAGSSSELAERRGAIVTGIDAAQNLIDIAKSRVPSGDFRVGDMEALPFDDDSFDVVFAANVIQFAADSSNALREFKRVCRPQGYITIGLFGEPETVESVHILKAVIATLPEPPSEGGAFALSARDSLESLFESVELEILAHHFVNCPMVYPDIDTFIKGFQSAGPIVSVGRHVGKEKVEQAMRDAVQRFVTVDGEVRIDHNQLQYLVAKNI